MPNTTEPTKMEERFDKQFPENDVYDGGSSAEFRWNSQKNKRIKAFIASERLLVEREVKERVRKEIEEMIESNDDGLWSGREGADLILELPSLN